MWFAIFCIVIFFLFIRPAYKVWKAVDAARRQAREMNDAFRRAAGFGSGAERGQEAGSKRASRKGGWTAPVMKRKKIDPSVGEYIPFKEVDSRTAPAADESSASRPTTSEPQVEDVKWEDIT